MSNEPTTAPEPADAGSDLVINARVRIPRAALKFQFTRSAGAGGQHVNKTETAVEVSFDLANTPYLGEAERALALQKLRSQLHNREEAVRRLIELLRQSLIVPRRRRHTRPTRSSVEARLQHKKRRSGTKQGRRTDHE